MKRRHVLLPAVCVTASCLLVAGSGMSVARMKVEAPDFQAQGLGPFLLKRPLRDAAADALRFDPAAAHVGPGCDARDQVTVQLTVGVRTLSVMSMAGTDGRIEEIIALPLAPLPKARSAAACAALGGDFAASLRERLGPFEPAVHVPKPVSEEYSYRFSGGARAVARWFAGGRTCDIALHFEALHSGSSARG
ncbi:MAG: hypothetical protein CVU19_11125 [Betaproteobacteria bacterium HGW-Betaproteobacteria-13]|jgi:hypothetical protein|uniref:Lipoprotein n=1 Tax=Parazoarcus communis TaxID=41977 RepID=A0A2U8H4B3_9RHOO|nr:hypothetical protein [Parazoarcus communis]AWI80468.1 hypothetical protein CEW87_14525 [Parazoarcus communis]PKO60188.1 MAG: hypothetical protein CVU25_00405 [Betaproteobacteria bacterium HGW-Betaproteobacteria-19]PKO80664.1 MAG: hypothetical protein CVU19_11125 [Betaproteobacteria bacterium HGW-Betaproteobacteria-13]